MIDFLILLAVLFIVGTAFAIIAVTVRFQALTREFTSLAKRRAVAKQNPYKKVDIEFMVAAGMTPDQIEQAVRNAISDSMRKNK